MPNKPSATEEVAETVEVTAPKMSRIAKAKSLAKDPFAITTAASIVALIIGVVAVNRSNNNDEDEQDSEDV